MQEHAEGPRSKPLSVCPVCGATNAVDAKTCAKCEAKLETSPVPQSPGVETNKP